MILSRYWFIFSIINMVSFIICLEFFILHEYNNFDSYIYGQTAFTNSSVLADKSTNASFNTYVDIYTNGVLEWEDVPIKVTLMNEKVIMMDIKDKKTVEHFLKNPIYGLINSVDLIHQ